jgi:mannose-1-phosphate guanylyltransferase
MQEALQRAASIAPIQRTCSIVAAQHRRWWEAPLYHLPEENVIVQPENRGTAHGILLPLLHIVERDPNATVVLLPADHHVRDEVVMAQSLRKAAALATVNPDSIYLLGMEPDEPDTELGYIVPASGGRIVASKVLQFVEKPAIKQATALLDRGALWNVFIIAATARALLALYEKRFADTVMEMRGVVARDRSATLDAMAAFDLYQRLPNLDFSRDVLEGNESTLRVLPVPYCGWTDLGTPQRVAQTLQRLPRPAQGASMLTGTHLSLAAQHARLMFGGAQAMQGVLQ